MSLLPIAAPASADSQAASGPSADLSMDDIGLPPGSIVVGSTFRARFDLSNQGDADATGATLTIDVPASLTIGDITLDSGVGSFECSQSGTTIECELGNVTRKFVSGGDVAPTSYRTVRVQLTATEVASSLSITAATSSAADEPAPDPHPNSATATVEVFAREANLQPRLSPYTPVYAGQPFNQPVVIHNDGPAAAEGISAVVTLPAGLEFDYIPDPDCAAVANVLTCTRADPLPPGTDAIYPMLLRADAPATGLTSTLSVSSDTPEPSPDPDPNTVFATIDVLAPTADLETTVPSQPELFEGETGILTARVTNHGPASATSTSLDVEVPASFMITFSAVNSPAGVAACGASGQTVHCGVGDLPSNGTATASVVVVPSVSGTGFQLSASASTATAEPVPDPHANSAVGSFDVGARRRQLTGTVTGEGGLPLPDIIVRLFATTDTYWPSYTTRTATDGSYTFSAIPAGTFNLRFVPNDLGSYARQAYPANPLVVPAEGDVTGLDEHFGHTASLSGVVRSTGGTPVANVEVRAFRDGPFYLPAGRAWTTADGSYTIHAVAPGGYKVKFLPESGSTYTSQWYQAQPNRPSGTPLPLASGASQGGVDAVLQDSP